MLGAICVIVGDTVEELDFIGTQLAYHAPRRAHYHHAVRDDFVLGDQRVGADHAVFADFRAVEHHAVDADQRAVADGAAVDHAFVADADALAEHNRKAGIGMQHAAVLYLRTVADGNGVVVAAHHAVEPDADVTAEDDIADDMRARSDPVVAEGDDAAIS